MTRIVVATTNPGKLVELRALVPRHWKLLTLRDAGLDVPEETGQSFLDNALLKAQHATMSGLPAIADDSGLEVEGLDGAPGVHSARFAGPDATDEGNNRKLIRMLTDDPETSRKARFRCAVAIALPQSESAWASGEVQGRIIDLPRGNNGFGYDPHFEICDERAPDVSGRTMAELPLEEKNRLSHRARAYCQLLATIRERPTRDALVELFEGSTLSGDPSP